MGLAFTQKKLLTYHKNNSYESTEREKVLDPILKLQQACANQRAVYKLIQRDEKSLPINDDN